MVISVTNNTLVKQFLLEHKVEFALVVKGPLSKDELQNLHNQLGLTSSANGDYIIFVDPPIGRYDGIRGWLWQGGTLMDITEK